MKFLKIIGISLLVILGFILIVTIMAPRKASLQRSITIKASPSEIFNQLNGIKAINAWYPWSKIDPAGTKYIFSGPESGIVSKMAWEIDHQDVGTGSRKIIEMVVNTKVRTKMFFGGTDTPNYVDFIITQENGMSKVTWTFDGDMVYNPMNKIFGLFLERILGPSYEEGLQNLKKLVETK